MMSTLTDICLGSGVSRTVPMSLSASSMALRRLSSRITRPRSSTTVSPPPLSLPFSLLTPPSRRPVRLQRELVRLPNLLHRLGRRALPRRHPRDGLPVPPRPQQHLRRRHLRGALHAAAPRPPGARRAPRRQVRPRGREPLRLAPRLLEPRDALRVQGRHDPVHDQRRRRVRARGRAGQQGRVCRHPVGSAGGVHELQVLPAERADVGPGLYAVDYCE